MARAEGRPGRISPTPKRHRRRLRGLGRDRVGSALLHQVGGCQNRVEHVPAARDERLRRDEDESGDDHFGWGSAAVVPGLARRVADLFVPCRDDLASGGQHARAADDQLAGPGVPAR